MSNPEKLLQEKKSKDSLAQQNAENIQLCANTKTAIGLKPMVTEIKKSRIFLKKGFLNSHNRKPLYKYGSSEGSKKSLLQRCKIVDLSKKNK